MGLAASQARLLTITARLADNELRSQTINNAKMRLSTESSQASENYINALNNATLKFTNYGLDGTEKAQNLSFNALTAYSSYNTQYGLVNAAGQLLVSEDEAALFMKSGENLNTYLQYHGLTYETSYFKEVGNITNDGYVEPFNYITVSEMETMYKNYNSLENSQEVENFNKAYSKYVSSTSALENASGKVMESYFTSSSNRNSISYKSGAYEMNFTSSTLSGMLAELQDAFNNPDNTFALSNKIIGQFDLDTPDTDGVTDRQRYNDLLYNSVNAVGSGYTQTSDITLSEVLSTDENPIAAGTKVYKTEDGIQFTIDEATNQVTKVEYTGSSTDTKLDDTALKTNCSFEECINSIKLNTYDESNNITESTSYTADGTDANGLPKIKSKTNVTSVDADGAKEIVNNILTEILRDMESSYSKNFAAALYDEENPNAQTNRDYVTSMGIDLNKAITGSTKNLSEYYYDFANASDVYLKTIFAGTTEEDLANLEKIKAQFEAGKTEKYVDKNGNPYTLDKISLTDIDFLLRYMAAEGFSPSSNFETVIKEFMVDKVIEEYGTPKYAWQDSTDTNNTGNADAKAQWYTNMFNRMMQGYKVLENGLASSSEWIEYALESGIVTMEQVDSSYQWQGLDYKACARITEETDDAAVTKAEAEYNRAMNDIESKDNIYDLELKNIDTEHSSLQTEYESIKGVISKNVERTFNFYKNA